MKLTERRIKMLRNLQGVYRAYDGVIEVIQKHKDGLIVNQKTEAGASIIGGFLKFTDKSQMQFLFKKYNKAPTLATCEFCEEYHNEDEMNHDYKCGRHYVSVCEECQIEQQMRGG